MKVVKQLLRYLVIGGPIYGIYFMIKHLCECADSSSFCPICLIYVGFLVIINVYAAVLLLEDVANIWHWIWSEDE